MKPTLSLIEHEIRAIDTYELQTKYHWIKTVIKESEYPTMKKYYDRLYHLIKHELWRRNKI